MDVTGVQEHGGRGGCAGWIPPSPSSARTNIVSQHVMYTIGGGNWGVGEAELIGVDPVQRTASSSCCTWGGRRIGERGEG